MFPASCGNWEYTQHSAYVQLLAPRCETLREEAYHNISFVDDGLVDTRPIHARLFDGLTLDNQDYLAGNYRGAIGLECLEERPAWIDGHEGTKAWNVEAEMSAYHDELLAALDDLIALRPLAATMNDAPWLALTSSIFANFLERLFTIHPYANGNGHMGRLVVLLGFIKIQCYPRHWSIDERPRYDDQIAMHRAKNKDPLRKFILSALRGPI